MRGLSLLLVLLLSVCLCNVLAAVPADSTAPAVTAEPTEAPSSAPATEPATPSGDSYYFIRANISITYDGPAPLDIIRNNVATQLGVEPSAVIVSATAVPHSKRGVPTAYIVSLLVNLGYFQTSDANTKTAIVQNLANTIGNGITVTDVQVAASTYGCVAGTHLAEGGQCVCQSGRSGAYCENSAEQTCAMATSVAQVTANRPILDEAQVATFQRNSLILSIYGPTVTNRTYTNISFKNSVDAEGLCSLGSIGSYWTTELSTTGACRDKFNLVMPWMQHNRCGFAKMPVDASAPFWSYKGVISLSFSDHYYISYPLNTMLERKSMVYYSIFLSFPKVLNVTSNPLVVVYSNVTMHFALTQFNYDIETAQADVAATTVVNWPNMLHAHGMQITLPTGSQHLTSPLTLEDKVCTNQQDSSCMQTFRFKMSTDTCDFNGAYIMNFTVMTCRGDDVEYNCTHNIFGLVFTIADSDICGMVSIAPKVYGQLIAQEPDLATATNVFNVGTTANFLVNVSTGADMNNVYIQFKDVSYEIVGDTTRHYFMQNTVLTTTGSDGDINTKCNFTFNDASYRFSVFLHGSYFRVDPGQTVSYTFRVKAILTFEGNPKTPNTRSEQEVEVFWESSATNQDVSSALKVGVVNSAPANKAVAQEKSSSSSLVAPIAGGLSALVVVAVIAAVIIKKRASATYTML